MFKIEQQIYFILLRLFLCGLNVLIEELTEVTDSNVVPGQGRKYD